ncbi:transketolase [Candidatus Pelagibacter sp.]|uniref:transketolase n=1 Tax=Candidatus Pelagibacter sp. TaxID=2024849 RepID=UPI003F85B6A1
MKKNLKKKINRFKIRICELAKLSGDGHVPSALSILDIVWILYDKIVDIRKIKSNSLSRDHIILSKGHASLAQYVVLENKKIITTKSLNSFTKYNSNFGGHPDKNKIKGVEASTGSLGHGFPIAAGIAYSKKILNLNSKVFCIIGDGECNEGTIWETCLIASNYNLNNLICIVDKNKSTDRAINVNSIEKKFKSFNWKVIKINGHNHNQIVKSFILKSKKPLAIIADTIKGNGISFMEKNQHEWHHKKIDNKIYEKILKEIK